MKIAAKDYVINTVYRTNILPIISACNTTCIFCSHRQNPEGIEVFRLSKLSKDDFKEIISYLSPEKKIVIGESATRIIEGEPLLHEDFTDILTMIRKKFKRTPIQITTNGILLNNTLVDKMEELGGIELNISVNSIDPAKRKQILGLKSVDNIKEKILMLKDRLKFSASCVLVPEIFNGDDIEEIISFLDFSGAESVRLFLPGYTARSGGYVTEISDLYAKAQEILGGLRHKYNTPVAVEPAVITNLECRLEGVIKDSPAYKAGLKAGDVIVAVNKTDAITRVGFFNEIYRLAHPLLTVRRDEKVFEVVLSKEKSCSSGIVVLYDIDPQVVEQVKISISRNKAKKVLFVTSELAVSILDSLFKKIGLGLEYRVISVRNQFFGGTIKCAGLLTIEDIVEQVGQYLKHNECPDLIMIPPVMLDFRKNDLLGKNIKEIEDKLKIPIDTV